MFAGSIAQRKEEKERSSCGLEDVGNVERASMNRADNEESNAGMKLVCAKREGQFLNGWTRGNGYS